MSNPLRNEVINTKPKNKDAVNSLNQTTYTETRTILKAQPMLLWMITYPIQLTFTAVRI